MDVGDFDYVPSPSNCDDCCSGPHALRVQRLELLDQPPRDRPQSARPGHATVVDGADFFERVDAEQRRRFLGTCTPVRRSKGVPPKFDLGRVALEILGERLVVDLTLAPGHCKRSYFLAELLEAFAHAGG